MSTLNVVATWKTSAELELQEALETLGGSAETLRRIVKPVQIAKAPSKAPKPAGLSKPGKLDTPQPTVPSKPAKPDPAKQAGRSKPGKPVEKVGNM
jgi:hypothetical protein